MSQVDVIVPCYRYAHFLRQCVESILTQEGVEVRVLIVDDESPDDTPTVAAALVAEDPRVEYRRHETNRGHIETFNHGISWASGPYLLLLSADDVLAPGALRRAVELMERHPDVGLTYGRAIHTPFPGGHVSDGIRDTGSKVVPGVHFLRESCEDATNIVPTPTAVVRTSVQKAIGGYRADLPHTADLEMWLRFAAHSNVGIINAVQAYYRVHLGNMSTQYAGLANIRAKWDAFDRLFQQFGRQVEGADDLERLLRRNLSQEIFITARRLLEEDKPSCANAALLLARELDPRHWRHAWFRYRCKERLGPKAVLALSPLVKTLNSMFAVFRDRPLRQTAGSH